MEIEIARQIGQAIRKQRTASGLTQSQLAEKAHVDRSLIIRMESGEAKSLYPEKLLSVLHALDLKMLIEPSTQAPARENSYLSIKHSDKESIAKGKAFVERALEEAKTRRNNEFHGISEKLLASRAKTKSN